MDYLLYLIYAMIRAQNRQKVVFRNIYLGGKTIKKRKERITIN